MIKNLKIIIVDDEEDARNGINTLLENEKGISICKLCKNGFEAIEAIQEFKPDLIFLDIQMPEINGFEVLQSLEEDELPTVIFVTAYDQYALKAFGVHAVDYLLKPFSDKRFFEALNHAKKYIYKESEININDKLNSLLENYQAQRENQIDSIILGNHSELSRKGKLAIKVNGKILIINVLDLVWIEGLDYYIKLHTNDKTFVVRESMKNIERRLLQFSFVRIHKSYIVNIDMIEELESTFHGNYKVRLSNGKNLQLSKHYKNNLKSFFDAI